MHYYTMTTFLALSILIVLLIVISSSVNFNKKSRKRLKIAYSFAIIGTICEWIGILLEQKVLKSTEMLQSIIILTKVLKFCIVPTIPIFVSQAVFEKRTKSKISQKTYKILKTYIKLYEIVIITGFFEYKIGSNYAIIYDIYVISFIIATLYMFINAFAFCKYYQSKNEMELFAIIIFITIWVITQLLNPNVEFLWLLIAISGTFVYIYYNGIIQNIDDLTGLLNKRSFNKYKNNVEEEKVSLIVFDVNDFKLINDTYGHSEGDRILTEVAKILKEYYQEYGRVYRIGGDEFAAIIEKSTDKSEIEKIATRFKEKVEERNGQLKNEKKLEIPRISYGISVYNPKNNLEHSFEDVINEADEEMYNYKKIYKNQNKQQ